MTSLLKVLCRGVPPAGLSDAPFGPFDVQVCAGWAQAAEALRATPCDALVVFIDGTDDLRSLSRWQALSHAAREAAVIAVAPALDPELALDLVAQGVQDLLPAQQADAATLARALRLGVQRKRIEVSARRAFALDLATGLPNHAQLLEHMTHLLALREREPAPMALLVLRVDGLATTAAALGAEAANVLRRKVAVRLRAGLRASDVVAAIGHDAFAVLLAWIDAPADAMRVAAKLARSLQQPFNVAGVDRALALSVGVSQYPQHGRRAEELLRRAAGQAGAAVAAGRAGFAEHVERGPASAANDEDRGRT